MKKKKVIINDWHGCYPSNWKGLVVKDAIAHPAKYSSRLIRRIYDHLLEEGWVSAGDCVIDPFGGVALGAMDAMRVGLSWRGVELEERFAKTGNENIDLWNSKFSAMPRWNGDALLINGDSRSLVKLLDGSSDMLISSPPYADSIKTRRGSGFDYRKMKIECGDKTPGRESIARGYGETEGNLGAMAVVSSPPFLQTSGGTGVSKGMDSGVAKRHAAGNKAANAYGETEGQLTNLSEGDFQLAVSSPPYAETTLTTRLGFKSKKSPHKQSAKDLRNEGGDAYGESAGQLGRMKVSISSPPFEKGSEGVMRSSKFKNPAAFARLQATRGHGASIEAKTRAMQTDEERAEYGETEGNVGNASGNDFWSAARLIVEQTYAALAPGAHAVWVVKDFVKNKQRVPFCNQWRLLCEAVGFVTLHEHHALLVRDHGTSNNLDGRKISHARSSKSFFRRVAERNAALNAYWETLDEGAKAEELEWQRVALWNAYHALSAEDKLLMENGTHKHEPPTLYAITKAAKESLFEKSGELIQDWNRETAIDYEVVYCMMKPEGM